MRQVSFMPHAHDSPQSPLTVAVCMGRALPLRCPECGISPLFVPVRKVRSIWDWFTPLDGCPRCGYAYERETGYFLMAIGGVNYGIMAGLGLAIAMILDAGIGLSFRQGTIDHLRVCADADFQLSDRTARQGAVSGHGSLFRSACATEENLNAALGYSHRAARKRTC